MLLPPAAYRSFVWRQAWADVRHRYAGTGMGVVWHVVHPLATICIYSLVFSRIFSAPVQPGQGRFPYTLYLCAGFFPWIAFSDCVTRGCSAFQYNAQYLRKLPIPEHVFVAQSSLAGFISLSINFILLLLIALSLGWKPGWSWLLLPIPLLLLQGLGFGVGLLLGTLNVFFRDIAQWVDVSLKLVMWTVPIVYTLDGQSDWLRHALRYHPLMPELESIRSLFMDRAVPPLHDWVGMVVWPAAAIAIALSVLTRLRPEIRDVI
jgi:ABC-type polysaccharide/polyol phosphate export permease